MSSTILVKEMREVRDLFNHWNKLRKDIARMKFVRLVDRYSEANGNTSTSKIDEETYRLKLKTFHLLTNQTVDRAMNLRGPSFDPPVANMVSFPKRDYGERADRTKFRRRI